MAPLFGTHTKNTTVTKLRGCNVELQGSSKVGIRDTLVFLICLMCWGVLKGDRRLDLFCFTKLIKVGIRDTLVFLICLMCWRVLKGDRRLDLFCFTKLLTVWQQVPFEGVLVEAYKGTRRKHNMKFRQIGHTTSQYGQSFFLKLLVHGTGLLSLKLRHWLYLDQLKKIRVHPFRIIP